MAVIKDLIQKETDGTISFGDYTLAEKTKKDGFSHDGNLFKIKTFKDITRLEKNDTFMYESVPGTAVSHLSITDEKVTFDVSSFKDAEITLGLEAGTEYSVSLNGNDYGVLKTNLSGKLTLAVTIESEDPIKVEIVKK